MSIDGHKTLSGGHYRLTQESFNSSLAHRKVPLVRANTKTQILSPVHSGLE